MTDPKKLYAEISFSPKANESDQDILDTHILAFKYFFHLYKGSRILNDPKAIHALNFILHHSLNASQTVTAQAESDLKDLIAKASLKYDFPKILGNVIDNVYQRLLECYYIDEISKSTLIGSLALCLMSLTVLDNFCADSPDFCIRFQSSGGVATLFAIINNRLDAFDSF